MTGKQKKLKKFWKELKRRKVVKAIIFYATTAFILLQIIDVLVKPLILPEWVMSFFTIFLVVGFPFVIIFSWIFDVNRDGVEITVASRKENKNESTKTSTKKSWLSNFIIGILLIVVCILLFPQITQKIKGGKVDSGQEKSVAVSPFIDDSEKEGNTYIINGLMESILNNLVKIKDLKVISRTSIEKYRNNPKLISEIAEELNVNYIVEGSGQNLLAKQLESQ